jgi:hypothetical protein
MPVVVSLPVLLKIILLLPVLYKIVEPPYYCSGACKLEAFLNKVITNYTIYSNRFPYNNEYKVNYTISLLSIGQDTLTRNNSVLR